MAYSRRDFFKLAVMAGAASACNFRQLNWSAPPVETIYFGFSIEKDGIKKSGVVAHTLKEQKHFELSNEIHSISYSKKYDLKVFVPKLGKVSYFQKGDGELIPFNSAEGKQFYGHGGFDEKRDVFYTTQSTVNSEYQQDQLYDVGEVHVHRLSDFKMVKTIKSYGFNPHDLKVIGDEVIVCNGGDKSNVAIVDLTTEKLVSSYDLPTMPHISFGHMDMISPQKFVVATGSRSKSKPCPLFIIDRTQGMKQLPIPQALQSVFFGQLLSVAYFDGFIYATCPATGYVFVWNEAGVFLSALTIQNASSIAVSKQQGGVIVGSGNFTLPLRLIKSQGLIVTAIDLPGPKTQTGSHSLLLTT